MGSLHKKVIERPAGCITFKILFFVLVKGRSPSTATVGGANMHPDQSWIRLVAPEPFDRLHGSSCSSFYPFFIDGGVLSTLMIVLDGFVDVRGNHWCGNCFTRKQLMDVGEALSYTSAHDLYSVPATRDVTGYEAWFHLACYGGDV